MDICKEVGIEKKTNHSLRSTGATAMFAAGVPEKMIKEATGHKSSKALEIHERPTVPQNQALSNVLNRSCRGDLFKQLYYEHYPSEFPRSLSSGPTTHCYFYSRRRI